MKKIRRQLIVWLFDHSQRIYTSLFKTHDHWNIDRNDLLKYADHTLGKHLGLFLLKNDFQLIPKVERHDCYHVLCNYSTKVEDEIALQCLCYGNGKRSPYLYGAIILGVLILLDYYKYYDQSFIIGKNANAFHHYDYKQLLNVSINDFRSVIFSGSALKQLHLVL